MSKIQVRCPSCGSTVPADTDAPQCFCIRCGSRLDPSVYRQNVCPECRRELPSVGGPMDFCVYCGARLGGGSSAYTSSSTGFTPSGMPSYGCGPSGGYAVVTFNLPAAAGSKAFSSYGLKFDGKDMDVPMKGSRTYPLRAPCGRHEVEFREVSGSFIPKVKRGTSILDFDDGAVYDIVERNDGFDYIRR